MSCIIGTCVYESLGLRVTKELHDSHNDYPLALEKLSITKNVLSPYCETIRDRHNISVGQVSKLVITIRDKKNCILHYRNLRLYEPLGLRVTKVHRVLEL